MSVGWHKPCAAYTVPQNKFLTITKRKSPLDDNFNTSSNAQRIVSVGKVEDTISKKNRKYDQTKRVRHYQPE